MTKLRHVEQTDLFHFKFIQAAKLSSDSKWAAYVVNHIDTEDEKQFSAIWLVALETGETRQLTSGTAIDSNPQWAPNNKQVAFISTRNEKPQIYIIPVDGGEARALTALKQGVGGEIAWSPDGNYIAFTAGKQTEPRDPAKPYRVNRFVYRFNELGTVDDVVQSLYVVAVNGGDPRQLTNDNLINSNPQWSPDGKSLLYLVSMFPDIPDTFRGRMRIVDLVDGKSRDLFPEWGVVAACSWLPDGKRIAFEGQPHGLLIGSKSDLWVVDVDGTVPECRTAGLKVGVGGGLEPDMPVIAFLSSVPTTRDGSQAFVPVQEGGTVGIYQVALQGAESFTPLVSGDRAALLMDVKNQQLLYLVSDFNLPTDLYTANATNATDEKRLTNINETFLADLELPKVERLQFSGADGAQVEGWIWKPAIGTAPYATILLIHGGPHGAWGHMFNFHAQMFCGAGYAVLQINHRASIGYGNAFSTAIKGDWGNLDYKDLMAGVDYAIAQGFADPNRLGVCGLSGGGNLTTWTIGQTTRFKAAVPENPVTNWQSFYGVSDIGVWFAVEQMGGHPHEIPEVYAKCSPITFAHRCKTPTLLVQGESDWRCPPEQSEQFYTVLKANGCIAEMLRFPNSHHAGAIRGDLAVRRVHNEALLEWMNRYVLGKTE